MLEPAKPLNDAQMCGSFFYYIMISHTVPFGKGYTAARDLVSLLQERGLFVSNTSRAEHFLEHIGYYRLSAYMYPLLKIPKNLHLYKEGATFEQVMMLYRFDKKLRVFLFNELEKIGSSGFWSDKVCHLCLEFEVMSHGGTERTEDY